MSSTDHRPSGVPETNDKHESGATTSPQNADSQPTAIESPSAPIATNNGTGSVAETAPSVAPTQDAQSDAAAVSNHPASGGDTVVAPMTATTGTTTTAAATDNAPTVAQPQSTDQPIMDTEETKPDAEQTTDQSGDTSGKEVEEDAGPSLVITLLLTTGSRYPFTIDGKYLRKQSVNVENYDPFAMSVYTLKELIWREWRSGKSDRSRRRQRCHQCYEYGL